MVAALVLLLNLNSFLAAMALSPVCITRAEDFNSEYDFWDWCRRVLFWTLIAAASLLMPSNNLQASLPAVTKMMDLFNHTGTRRY